MLRKVCVGALRNTDRILLIYLSIIIGGSKSFQASTSKRANVGFDQGETGNAVLYNNAVFNYPMGDPEDEPSMRRDEASMQEHETSLHEDGMSTHSRCNYGVLR
jgi:hypothetical protein